MRAPDTMGIAIDAESLAKASPERYARKVEAGLAALKLLLEREGFGVGAKSVGAELEVFLVDATGAPLSMNQDVLNWTHDPRLTLELARFNLECNTRPAPLAGRPFSFLSGELLGALGELGRSAAPHGGRLVAIGILPTLTLEDLGKSSLSDAPRYRALSAGLRRCRKGKVKILIEGEEKVDFEWNDISLEGANTSFQIHLRIDPKDFARHFNAAQLATAPVLAISTNSPLFLGKKLWAETRVALFQQSSIDRDPRHHSWDPPRRVSFGHGWVRSGPLELFEEVVALHPPVLPICGEEDPLAVVKAGGVPRLDELALHSGTVWRWNRAVYGATDGGHVRIELRTLPAGPTMTDMLANAALHLGLTLGLADRMERLMAAMPFPFAAGNFYRAARLGMDAELVWPAESSPSPVSHPAPELVLRLLPIARAGLLGGGVDPEEADRLLAVIARRCERRVTGASWQRRALALFEPELGRNKALQRLVDRYQNLAHEGHPVHEWPER